MTEAGTGLEKGKFSRNFSSNRNRSEAMVSPGQDQEPVWIEIE